MLRVLVGVLTAKREAELEVPFVAGVWLDTSNGDEHMTDRGTLPLAMGSSRANGWHVVERWYVVEVVQDVVRELDILNFWCK